jgi:hypothetical protein
MQDASTKQAASKALLSCLAFSSTLVIKAASFSETSLDLERTATCYIPKYGSLLFQ